MEHLFSPALAVLAILGGNALILYASIPARHILPGLLVGILLVSLGTTIPEFAITLHAALKPVTCETLRNLASCTSSTANNYAVLTKQIFPVAVIVGSCFANLFLVSGLAGLTLRKDYSIESFTYGRDLPALIIAIIAIIAITLFWDKFFPAFAEGRESRVDPRYVGYGLLGMAVVYVIAVMVSEMMMSDHKGAEGSGGPDLITALFFLVIGIGALGLGVFTLSNETPNIIEFVTHQKVDFETDAARNQSLYLKYGLLFIGLAVAIPEMLATLFAWLRREPSTVTGNFIGSSIFNLLGVLGLGIVLSGGEMMRGLSRSLILTDLFVLLGGAVLLGILLRTGRRLEPLEGLLLMGIYIAYWILRFNGMVSFNA